MQSVLHINILLFILLFTIRSSINEYLFIFLIFACWQCKCMAFYSFFIIKTFNCFNIQNLSKCLKLLHSNTVLNYKIEIFNKFPNWFGYLKKNEISGKIEVL